MAIRTFSSSVDPTEDNLTSESTANVVPEQEYDIEVAKLLSSIYEGSNVTESNDEIDTGFSISFTTGKTYDLDEIIASIRRDNEDRPLLMKVNFEEVVVRGIAEAVTNRILDEFSADSAEQVLDFNNIFSDYFERYYTQYENDIRSLQDEGELAIDERQEKVKVERSDMRRYLFEEAPKTGPIAPVIDYSKAYVLWNELGLDGTEESEVNDKEIYKSRILSLLERVEEIDEDFYNDLINEINE